MEEGGGPPTDISHEAVAMEFFVKVRTARQCDDSGSCTSPGSFGGGMASSWKKSKCIY